MAIDIIQLKDATAAGPCIRIVIADHKGSSPRETGTAMVVTDDGISGTIGGGALEFSAIETARKMLGTDRGSCSQTIPLGPNLGQCCGGAVTLVFERFTKDTIPSGSQPFLRGIGSASETLKVKRATKSMRNVSQGTQLLWIDNWLIEPVVAQKQPLWIFGAGHVGRALIDVFWDLPFDITWIDTATDRFPNEIPDRVTQLIATDPTAVVKHAPSDAFHLILTYSHAIDLALCNSVLSGKFSYCGVIGSASKAARFRKRLTELGHSAQSLSRLTCPIGNPDLGKEPKAIALGVATELLMKTQSNAHLKDQNYG